MKTKCLDISTYAFEFNNDDLKAGPLSRWVRLVIALTFFCSYFVSVNVAAQATTPASTVSSTIIELSPEDKIALSGIHQYREHVKNLAKVSKGASVLITVLDDQGKLIKAPFSQEFKEQLLAEDISVALATMQEWKLEFKYPILGQSIKISIEQEATPEYLLFRAAMVNHLEFAQTLLRDNNIDPDTGFGPESREVTPLFVATESRYGEMVELLLNAGSDPNKKRGGGKAPLGTAVKNKDTVSTRALLQAGATIKAGFGRPGVRSNLFTELVKDNKLEIVQLLLANGAQVGRSRSSEYSVYSLTPLMHALVRRQSQMALALMPYSDPRVNTGVPIERSQSGVEDIRVMPRANALFLAQLRQPDLDDTIEQAIEKRIEALGGEEAVMLSRILAAGSMSDFVYRQGKLEDAKAILEKALDKVSVDSVKNANDSSISFAVKLLLAKKHELSIILDKPFADDDQAMADELASFGEPADHLHAMLETVKAAQRGDFEPQLNKWRQQYSGRNTRHWGYSRLNDWIGSMVSESDKKRLYRAVDYFEFSVSSWK